MSGTRQQPAFHTGDSAWDNALGTISGTLFPDPSRAGQAYYYGTEARAKQIEGYKNIGQINAENRLYGFNPGSGVPRAPLEFTQPPIAGMGPIMAPANNLPMQAPPAPVNATSLGGTVAQGSPLGPGGQPFTGGGAPPPPIAMSPATLGQIVAPGTDPNVKGFGATGTPPPASPPAPGAPPAPNTTTTNGQPPADNQGDGPIHPGWVGSPDGGKKYSAPAAANGSPAPAPFDLGTYMQLQASAGRNAEMAKVQAISYIVDAENRGILPQGTGKNIADKMAAHFGSSVYESGQATQRNAATVAGGIRQAEIHEGGQNTRAGMVLQDIIDANDPTKITRTPLAQMQRPMVGYNPDAAKEAVKSVETQPGGLGTAVFSSPVNLAQKNQIPLAQPTVENTRASAENAIDTYVDLKNPTQLLRRSYRDAKAQGLVAAPKTPDEWTALATSAAANAKSPEEAEAIRARVLAASLGGGKPQDPIENLRNQNLVDRQLAQVMRVPGSHFPGYNVATNTNPPGSSPALSVALTSLTDEYFTRSPDNTIRGNRIAAANAAIKQMIEEGYINPDQDRGLGLSGDTSTNKGVVQKDGSVTQVPHFQVHLIDPKTKQPLGPEKVPQIKMKGAPTLSSVVAEGKNHGPAEPGTPEGTAGTLEIDGRKVRVVVKNGNYIEVPGG